MDNFPPSDTAASALPNSFARYAIPNFSSPLLQNLPVWPLVSRRFQLSPQKWDELRPVIQHWYIDEGKPFKEVKLVLETHHNFSPTKRQFDDKIKKWGLKKNANRRDRKLFLSDLSDAGGVSGVQQTTLKLNPKKLERWKREERLTEIGIPFRSSAAEAPSIAPTIASNGDAILLDCGTEARNETRLHQTQGPSSWARVLPKNEMPSERALSPLRETLKLSPGLTEIDMDSPTIWDLANIPSSPTLTGLRLAFEIDKQFSPPSYLHSDSANHQLFYSQDELGYPSKNRVEEVIEDGAEAGAESATAFVQYSGHYRCQKLPSFFEPYSFSRLLEKIERSWSPFNEVYPFPISAKSAPTSSIVINSMGKTMMVQIAKSEARLRSMEKLFLKDSPEAVDEMDSLANLYTDMEKYGEAESLYYRVLAAQQKSSGNDSKRTLQTYLTIVRLHLRQGNYEKADQLYQAVHQRILDLFNPGDDMAIYSRKLLAGVKYGLSEDDEAENLQRDLLQLYLNKFGPKHDRTNECLCNLGLTMLSKGNFPQAEQLLVIALQMLNLLQGDKAREYRLKVYLGVVLNKQGKSKDTTTLLKHSVRQFFFWFGTDNLNTLNGIAGLVECLGYQGEFLESEVLIRQAVLRRERRHGPTHPITIRNLSALVKALINLERWEEAATRAEELLRAEAEHYGLKHGFTLRTQSKLVHCYAMQGLYKDLSSLSARMETVLSQSVGTRITTEKYARKYGQTKERDKEDLEEVEEIRPLKRCRVMSCTVNLKA